MRERTNLSVIAEADLKSVQHARKILEETKLKYSKYSLIELRLGDCHNTVVIIKKGRFLKNGEQYYRNKYKKVLRLGAKDESIS